MIDAVLLDRCVRENMARRTMNGIADKAVWVEDLREEAEAAPPEKRGKTCHPSWLVGSVADKALSSYPGRVDAIRKAYREEINARA